ncbi:hypothetical protein LEN26_021012 [Aphanomyces euteiches]|nr:hypothetical protein LEN26_021012 [Aphanomyces euteiches]
MYQLCRSSVFWMHIVLNVVSPWDKINHSLYTLACIYMNSVDHFPFDFISSESTNPPSQYSPMSYQTVDSTNSRDDAIHVQNALLSVADRTSRQRNERRRYSTQPREDHDDPDTISPIYDKHVRCGGTDGIKSFTNFSQSEFEDIWYAVKSRVLRHWNVGKGRKCPQTGKDMLFMLLTIFKIGCTWEVTTALFNFTSATFERMMAKFLLKVYEHLYDLFVVDEAATRSMSNLVASGKTFRNYQSALYAVDVSFQQGSHPHGPHNEALHAFSGKHHLYGKKVEISVSPAGVALNVSVHEPGSIHDKTIFHNNEDFHLRARLKKSNERIMEDSGPLRDEYPDEWALLADKGYQSLQHKVRAVIPSRSTRENRLTIQVRDTNAAISSDRIIVENWFGRHCTLWEICGGKFKWSDNLYDPIFKACASLTNFFTFENAHCAQKMAKNTDECSIDC